MIGPSLGCRECFGNIAILPKRLRRRARIPLAIMDTVVNTLNNRPIRLINEDAPLIREAIA